MTKPAERNASSESATADSRPSLQKACLWSLAAGVVAGGLGVAAAVAIDRLGQGGIAASVCLVLLSLLGAGLLAGPGQRHQWGGSAAAIVAFGILLAAGFAINRPIAAQSLRAFQLQFIAGIGLLAATLLGAAGASVWTHRITRRPA